MSMLPPAAALPKPVRALAAEYVTAYNSVNDLEANDGRLQSDTAKQTAAAQDQSLMLAALKDGTDPETIGQPNEMGRRARSTAAHQAVVVMRAELSRVEYDLGKLLLTHREDCRAAAGVGMPKVAEAYAKAVEDFKAARIAYNDALGLIQWANTISPRDGVPNYSAGDLGPTFVTAYNSVNADVLLEMLATDTQRHVAAEKAEAKRLEWQQQQERIEAQIATEAADRQAQEERSNAVRAAEVDKVNAARLAATAAAHAAA
jgi:hypothetical protein